MSSCSPSGSSVITDALCANCGLCCDGSLLADVELAGEEESGAMEALGLEVEEGDDDCDACVMPLPCAALKGTRCSIYSHRPETCRTFECRLLKEAEAGRVSVEEAGEIVRAARGIVNRLDALLGASENDDRSLPLMERVREGMAASSDAAVAGGVSTGFAEFEALVEFRFLGG